jgi:hypothetical protein
MTALPRSAARALIDSRAWTHLSWAGVAVFALWLALLIQDARWPELRMAACFFLPLVLLLLIPHGLPPVMLALGTLCFLVSAAGWALDWYGLWWWFDVALHTLNPFALMTGSMYMLWKAELIPARRPGRFVLWATGLGLAMGIGWELIEVTYLDLTWPDTILDLVMNTAGAAFAGSFALWMIRARGLPPVGRRPRVPLPQPMPVRVRR